jgi:hypothetical protein
LANSDTVIPTSKAVTAALGAGVSFATAAQNLANASSSLSLSPASDLQNVKNLKPVVASAAVLDVFTKSGGAVPDASNIIGVNIPDGNGSTYRTRAGSVASGTSIITLADAANYWSKGSLAGEIKTAWLYAIYSTADAGIVWALGGYSGFTIVPTTTTATDDDYFLLEGSSTYSRAATDRCIAVAKIRYSYSTADTPDHTIQATGMDAPQVIWNPKSDYTRQLNLASTVTVGSDIAEYSAISMIVKQSGAYDIFTQAKGGADGQYTVRSRIKTGSPTYASATQKAYAINSGPAGGDRSNPGCQAYNVYLNAGDTVHHGIEVVGNAGSEYLYGDDDNVGCTFLAFNRVD